MVKGLKEETSAGSIRRDFELLDWTSRNIVQHLLCVVLTITLTQDLGLRSKVTPELLTGKLEVTEMIVQSRDDIS